jgi:hypothetical protein
LVLIFFSKKKRKEKIFKKILIPHIAGIENMVLGFSN